MRVRVRSVFVVVAVVGMGELRKTRSRSQRHAPSGWGVRVTVRVIGRIRSKVRARACQWWRCCCRLASIHQRVIIWVIGVAVGTKERDTATLQLQQRRHKQGINGMVPLILSMSISKRDQEHGACAHLSTFLARSCAQLSMSLPSKIQVHGICTHWPCP